MNAPAIELSIQCYELQSMLIILKYQPFVDRKNALLKIFGGEITDHEFTTSGKGV